MTKAGEGDHPALVAHTLSCSLSSSYACLLWRVCPDLDSVETAGEALQRAGLC